MVSLVIQVLTASKNSKVPYKTASKFSHIQPNQSNFDIHFKKVLLA